MNYSDEVYLTNIFLSPVQDLIRSHINETYVRNFRSSTRKLITAIKRVENGKNSAFTVDQSILDRMESLITMRNLFIGSQILKQQKIKISMAQSEYPPLTLLKNSKISKRNLTAIQYEFAYITLLSVKDYLRSKIGHGHRNSLESFLYQAQVHNPTYFKLIGFRPSNIGNINLNTIEKRFERLTRQYDIKESDYL